MRALILERPGRQISVGTSFERLGVVVASKYNPIEKYDLFWEHFDGDFSFVDNFRSQQPNCLTIAYSSTIEKEVRPGTIGASMEEKLRAHFHDLVYYNESLFEVAEKFVNRLKNLPNPSPTQPNS
jgi:hypothetical protein